MNLIKYDNLWNDPFTDVDKWFDGAFGLSRWPSRHNGLPNSSSSKSFRVNIYDDNDNYYVLAELPGVDKKDVDIQLENAALSIKGERKHKLNDEEATTKFTRTITIAEDVDVNRVSAELKDGLLQVTLPKAEERLSIQLKQ